jgi:ABC-type nitrate/sulfonate/bicarbonate transport system ATPase subunit
VGEVPGAGGQPKGNEEERIPFQTPLLSLDATARDNVRLGQVSSDQRGREAASILEHDGYLPSSAALTEGKQQEVRVARQMQFTPGTILLFDRAYADRNVA